jgi:O-antigen polymerase
LSLYSVNLKINIINAKYLLILPICTLFIILPYYYEQRLILGIFNTDIYLLWIAGCICWLFNVLFFQFTLKRLSVAVILGFAYALLVFFFKSHQDFNGIHFLITSFSCIGIICYLKIINSTKYYFFITAILLSAFFIQIYIGYKQAINNDFESLSVKGQLFNSGFFGNYLAGVIPLLLSGFITKSTFKWSVRILFLGAFIVSSILLSLTVARAAFVGTGIGCIIIMWPYLKKVITKKWIVFSLLIILVIAGFVELYKLKPASALGRLTVYKVCLNMIKDHPLLGIGPNRFSAEYNNYQAAYFEKENVPIETQLLADNTFEAFNSILQILVEYGIAGFLILLLIIYKLLKQVISSKRDSNKNWLYVGSCGCIISIIIASFFSNPFHVSPILLIFCYHLSVILSVSSNQILNVRLKPKEAFLKLTLMSIICICILSFAFFQYKAEVKWKKASELALYDDFNKAKTIYEKAYPYLKFNGNFLFNYGAAASLAANYNLSINLLKQAQRYISTSNLYLYLGQSYAATNQFALAEKNYIKAIYIAPSHIYPKYQLILLYMKWDKISGAKKWIDITLSMPVKIPSEFTDSLISKIKDLKLQP